MYVKDVNMVCKVLSQKNTIIKICYQFKIAFLIHLKHLGLQTPDSFGNRIITLRRVESSLVQRYHGDDVKLEAQQHLDETWRIKSRWTDRNVW